MTERDKRTKGLRKSSQTEKAEKEDTRVTSLYTPNRKQGNKLPLFLEAVSAGFPSPAEDYLEGQWISTNT